MKQAVNEVVENPIGLKRDAAREVVEALNADLGSLYVLYHQYKKHHWVVEGAEYYPIHLLLDKFAEEALKVADAVAERVTALGGVPVASPAKQQEVAFVKPEAEGVFDLRKMLEHDLELEQVIIARLREQIELTMRVGDFGTEYLLKEALLADEKRAHELDHLLARESLTKAIR